MKKASRAPGKRKSVDDEHARLLGAFVRARALRKKASALEDMARARITTKGYDIEHEYGPGPQSEPKMKLKRLEGLPTPPPKKNGRK